MLNVIQNIYKDIKSNIIFNNSKSDYFPCDNGIRQGENLSTFLFAIFLNDLEDFLENHNVTGLLTISQDIENIMNVYIDIFLLLYADVTVLMAETPEDLQKQLNIFHAFILLINNLYHNPSSQILSKAFSKSINAQYIDLKVQRMNTM
jgi:hypothetical protein